MPLATDTSAATVLRTVSATREAMHRRRDEASDAREEAEQAKRALARAEAELKRRAAEEPPAAGTGTHAVDAEAEAALLRMERDRGAKEVEAMKALLSRLPKQVVEAETARREGVVQVEALTAELEQAQRRLHAQDDAMKRCGALQDEHGRLVEAFRATAADVVAAQATSRDALDGLQTELGRALAALDDADAQRRAFCAQRDAARAEVLTISAANDALSMRAQETALHAQQLSQDITALRATTAAARTHSDDLSHRLAHTDSLLHGCRLELQRAPVFIVPTKGTGTRVCSVAQQTSQPQCTSPPTVSQGSHTSCPTQVAPGGKRSCSPSQCLEHTTTTTTTTPQEDHKAQLTSLKVTALEAVVAEQQATVGALTAELCSVNDALATAVAQTAEVEATLSAQAAERDGKWRTTCDALEQHVRTLTQDMERLKGDNTSLAQQLDEARRAVIAKGAHEAHSAPVRKGRGAAAPRAPPANSHISKSSNAPTRQGQLPPASPGVATAPAHASVPVAPVPLSCSVCRSAVRPGLGGSIACCMCGAHTHFNCTPQSSSLNPASYRCSRCAVPQGKSHSPAPLEVAKRRKIRGLHGA